MTKPKPTVQSLRQSAPKRIGGGKSDKPTLAKCLPVDGMTRGDRDLLTASVDVSLLVIRENLAAAIDGLQAAAALSDGDLSRLVTVKFPGADESGHVPAGVNVNLPAEYAAVTLAGDQVRKFVNLTARVDGQAGEALFPYAGVSAAAAADRDAEAAKSAAPSPRRRPSRAAVRQG